MPIAYDEDSPSYFQPNIEAEYLSRLGKVFERIQGGPENREHIIEDEIEEIEESLPNRPPKYDKDKMAEYEEQIKYLAVLEALLDLLEIGYYVERDPESIDGTPPVKIYPPDPDRFEDEPEKFKEHEREILEKERVAQFQEENNKKFIRRMETPKRHQGKTVSILDLIADGEELYSDLAELQDLEREEITQRLADTIQPYLQVAEKGTEDEHTGLDLHDIWRYFRYTWLTPYNTIPGRNINFLIRDASREHHPVMGIASLASSMMNLKVRDQFIGWRIDAVKEELEQRVRVHTVEQQLPQEERTPDKKTEIVEVEEPLETDTEYKQRINEYCSMLRSAVENAIEASISEIRYDDFTERYDDLSEVDFEQGTETAFTRLNQLEGLATYVFKNEPPLTTEVEKPDDYENVFDPAEFDLLADDLDDVDIKDDDPDSLDTWEEKSATALFIKKRAHTLQKLLRDREYFRDRETDDDKEFIENAIESEQGNRALRTALKEIKKRRVGAGMMNIQVCGAIPPYNHILGGKLTAMTLTGPELIEAYRSKYEGSISEIASAMKGEPVIKENELVFLDTTSLFKTGSAQYDRIRIPTPNGQIEYQEIGKTSGYGSVQFGNSAQKRLSQVTEIMENRQAVRGRFGEGVAPKMRKIRRGLENLGLDGELLKHESPRIIYATPIAKDYREYLFGLTDNPEYYWGFEDISAEQERIYDHWRHRWVSKRIQKDWVLEDIRNFDKEEFKLGEEIEYENRALTEFGS